MTMMIGKFVLLKRKCILLTTNIIIYLLNKVIVFWSEDSQHINIRDLAKKAAEAVKDDDTYLEMLKYYMLKTTTY